MVSAALRRLLAIDDPPERTALAFSIGVFITFSPFIGLHTIIATILAFLFRLNKIAIYTGTYINNPLTLVPIIVVSYGLGALILGRSPQIPPEGMELLQNPHPLTGSYYRQLFTSSWYLVEPFAIGGALLSVVCSLVSYPLTLRWLREHRRKKAEKRKLAGESAGLDD
ncbi:MAG: uncharacterized protein QOD75_2615 [Blastocatellia bacterium]|jgi:uncharacterized protein (DUF2062 family)|nr:uncharacterized protein [Blastocatellia bacterium]